MAGMVMQVTPKRTLDFTNVLSGFTQDVVLAQGIDISQWREVSLMVRAHSTTFGAAVGSIAIYAQAEGRTAEDPGILFVNSAQSGTVTVDNSTVAPMYTVGILPANFGSMIKIVAQGKRIASGNSIKADLSIDLSMKSA